MSVIIVMASKEQTCFKHQYTKIRYLKYGLHIERYFLRLEYAAIEVKTKISTFDVKLSSMITSSLGEALSTFIRASRDPKGGQQVWVTKSKKLFFIRKNRHYNLFWQPFQKSTWHHDISYSITFYNFNFLNRLKYENVTIICGHINLHHQGI